MTAEVRRELEEMVEDIRGLVAQLRPHDQPLAIQLLEMAVLEIKGRMYGIGDEEFDALIDTLSGVRSPAEQTEPTQICDQPGLPARTTPSGRVVAFGAIRRGKCKRRS